MATPWLPAGALASGIASLVFLRYLWAYRSKPGARFFIGTIACEALWSFSYGAALLVFDPTLREILEIPIWLGVNFIGVFFLAFALEYTGRGSLVRSRWMGALLALQTVHTGIVATNPVHGIAWSEYSIEPVFGAATVTYTHGPWLFVNVTGVILMIAGASFLLFDTFFSYGPLYRTQAAAVAISPVLPGAAFLLWLFQVGGFWRVNLTPLTFPIHLAFDAYAFFSREMFELTPATRRAGERAAIDDLGTAVLIVDEDGRLVDLNAEARRVLGVEGEAVLGHPITEHLDGVDPSGTDEVLSLTVEDTNRQYAVTTSAIEDASGTPVGRTVVLQDVTVERRREQRLAVLNRVLRHNLRNDLGVVKGYIEVAADRADEERVSEPLATAAATTEDVIALGEKARDVERMVGSTERAIEPVDVPGLLAGIKTDLDGDGAVRIDVPDAFQVRAEPAVLDRVFRSLIENGLEHGGTDPQVEVECTDVEKDRATFEIRDDGPGIPDHEREVLDAGEETALRHGSGLGLWIAEWGVTAMDGELRFETGDGGTTAVVTLPHNDCSHCLPVIATPGGGDHR
ncbi:MAG: histidine kinase N-terminal 7TM domain-containing protein [Halobacteriales archaeon]